MKRAERIAQVVAGALAGTALCVAPLLTTSCAPRYVISAPSDSPQVTPPRDSVTRHVVLISVDGLRPDAIEKFEAPTLRRLVSKGSYSLSASTILPSKTLPSHTSMLTGVPPDRHGIVWNDARATQTDDVALPTIFTVARSNGYRTAAFFSKSKFHSLQRPGTLDYSKAPGGWFGRWSSDRIVTDVETYLGTARPNVLFVHLADPDAAGHQHGWMSADYGRGVLSADAAIAKVLVAADRAYGPGEYSLIVTADHGGHDRDHGSSDSRDVTIPWIAWGQGVIPGRLAGAPIHTMDTAATVLWVLGLSEPPDWTGVPVMNAFHAPSTRTGSALLR